MSDVIKKIVDEVGSKKAIASALGITKGAVSQWDVVPPKHASKLSELTGGKVSVSEILDNKLLRHPS